MNRGNIKPKPVTLDDRVERLNQKIARFLGKKDKLPPPKKTSNSMFMLIIVPLTLLLWAMTGFYYISDSQYGVILTDGKISRVVKGLKVGVVLPYPFGNIEIIDAGVSTLLNISSDTNNPSYMGLTKDLQPVVVTGDFSYQVTDPKTLYQNYLQEQDTLDGITRWNVEEQLHSFIAQKTLNELSKANLTILADQLQENINQVLANYGIKLIKLNINSLQEYQRTPVETTITNESAIVVAIPPVSDIVPKLLEEANVYQENQIIDTEADINKFNQLLPQYQANPQAIVEQMYYELLAAVPLPKTNQYPLLKMSLSDLIALERSQAIIPTTVPADDIRGRHLDREVIRERDLDEQQ